MWSFRDVKCSRFEKQEQSNEDTKKEYQPALRVNFEPYAYIRKALCWFGILEVTHVPEKVEETVAIYKTGPKHPGRSLKKKRHRKKRNKIAGKVGSSLRHLILMEQKGKCASCSLAVSFGRPDYRPDSATVDHIIRITDGGKSVRENLQILCWPCHAKKDYNPPKQQRRYPIMRDAFEKAGIINTKS